MTLMDIIRFCVSNKIRNQGDIFSMRCPFHKGYKASMAINIVSGSYHCFGCQASGNTDEIRLFAELVRVQGKITSKILCKVEERETDESERADSTPE